MLTTVKDCSRCSTVVNYSNTNTVKLGQTFWNLWVSGNSGASRENLNCFCLNAVAVVQTTVQTVQPEQITYLLEQLLGGGVKEP